MVKNHSENERENPLPQHSYYFRLAARILLYASSHKQNNTYHGLCYTSRGALAGTRNTTVLDTLIYIIICLLERLRITTQSATIDH